MENLLIEKREDKIYTGVTTKVVDKILNLSRDKELEIDFYYGNLTDNYIINNFGGININNQNRKFIIIVEEYKNCWSSNSKIILTDNEKTVGEYRELFER